MKKSSFGTYFSLILLTSLMVGGCALNPPLTKIKDVWKYENYSGGYLDRVMIVGKPRVDAARIQYEDYMVKALEKRKIDIVPSYTAIPEMKDLTRDNVKRAADAAGVKAVLATKVVGVDEKEVLVNQTQKMDYIATPHGTYMRPYLDGPKVVNFKKVRVETGLFDVKSEKLIWVATSAIMNPESADEAIKDFSKAIIQQLITDGYIRP